jgi:hypothetical protein
MDALIVTTAGTGLAPAMLLVPALVVATVVVAVVCLFIATSAAVLACIVGVPVA